MWFLLALGSAVFFSAQSFAAKQLGKRMHPDVVVWANFLLAMPLYIVVLLAEGLPEIGSAFWGWLLLSAGCNLFAMPLFFRALEQGDLSIVLPLAALTPLFTLGTEAVLLQESPTLLGLSGVFLVVLGAYTLHATDIRFGPLAPLRALAHDRGAWQALATAAIWSVSAVADRGGVLASSPSFYLVAFGIVYCSLLFPWLAWKHRRDLASFFRRPLPCTLVALPAGLMAICQMFAVRLALAAEVIAIKRLAALIGVLVGGLALHERGMFVRLVASSTMVAGAALLALS